MSELRKRKIHQYLTFKLVDDIYAINVSGIKEVLSVSKITKIPKMPEFMLGIINVRGGVVPVLDLCKKFDLGETKMTIDTSIIVTEILLLDDDSMPSVLTIGILSDMVQKVITIEPSSIESAPKIGISIDDSFIDGVGHIESEFIIILNINKILTGEELLNLQANEDAQAEDEEVNEDATRQEDVIA